MRKVVSTAKANMLWTEEEKKELYNLRKDGTEWYLIASKLGRSRSSVKSQYEKIKRLGGLFDG